MNKLPKSNDMRGAIFALERAALRAREIAIQTNTSLIIATEDGQCLRVDPNFLSHDQYTLAK